MGSGASTEADQEFFDACLFADYDMVRHIMGIIVGANKVRQVIEGRYAVPLSYKLTKFKFYEGMTCLHNAVMSQAPIGRWAIVDLILYTYQRQLEREKLEPQRIIATMSQLVNQQTRGGTSALNLACGHVDDNETLEIVRLLVEGNKDFKQLAEKLPKTEDTAEKQQDQKSLPTKTCYLANVNQTGSIGLDSDEKNWTALMTASKAGNLTVVDYLVQNGAAVNHRNDEGKTALGCARFYDDAMVKLLKSYGATY